MFLLTDSASIFRYHRDMIALHGHGGAAALGWTSKESQLVRFQALAQIADLNGCSVLDAGCGYGDLYRFLYQLYPQITYTGIEQIPELLEEAKKRYAPSPKITFLEGNFNTMSLPVADYVFASGSLNYRSSDPQFIFDAVSKLYSNCKLGLAFNLLSQIKANGLVVAYNPDEIFAWCNTICQKVTMKSDYADDDFTIFLLK